VFPELDQQVDFVGRVVKEEEESFLRTLDKGLRKIDEVMNSSSQKIVSGSAAFELLDTYGFPIDLTRLIARENDFTVDESGFEKEMQQQKDRSRAATAMDTEDWIVLDDNGSVEFVGYNDSESDTRVVKYRKVKGKAKSLTSWCSGKLHFYAESGGQIGDSGWINFAGTDYPVFDTKKENDLIIHFLARFHQI
jgi:alanyl-tRNA synthetase